MDSPGASGVVAEEGCNETGEDGVVSVEGLEWSLNMGVRCQIEYLDHVRTDSKDE